MDIGVLWGVEEQEILGPGVYIPVLVFQFKGRRFAKAYFKIRVNVGGLFVCHLGICVLGQGHETFLNMQKCFF